MKHDLKEIILQHTYNAIEEVTSKEKAQEQLKEKKTEEKALGALMNEQTDLMKSAIELSNMQAFSIMIPTKELFMISYEDSIDKFQLQLILEKGYSRIPVYCNNDRNEVIGTSNN